MKEDRDGLGPVSPPVLIMSIDPGKNSTGRDGRTRSRGGADWSGYRLQDATRPWGDSLWSPTCWRSPRVAGGLKHPRLRRQPSVQSSVFRVHIVPGALDIQKGRTVSAPARSAFWVLETFLPPPPGKHSAGLGCPDPAHSQKRRVSGTGRRLAAWNVLSWGVRAPGAWGHAVAVNADGWC